MTPVVKQRGEGDCGVAALSMLLLKTYEDVYVAVAKIDRSRSRYGLSVRHMKRIAQELGTTLKERRKFDVELDDGILGVVWDDGWGHWVVLDEGRVIDPTDQTVCEVNEYLSTNKCKATVLLEAVS